MTRHEVQQDQHQNPNTSGASAAQEAARSRPSASAGLTPAQLAAAMAVVRHHAERLAQRRAARSETRGEPRERG